MKEEEKKRPPMTAGELIRILALFPKDKLVWIDGAPSDGVGPEWYRPCVKVVKNSNELIIEPYRATARYEAAELDQHD